MCTFYEEGKKDACRGDVGSPLVNSENVLVGLVSGAAGCGNPIYPRLQTRIASREITKFIREFVH